MKNDLIQKRIIHVDMDAFYASVEQRDNTELIGKPVVVGGKPDSRGVVSAASYEARRFGIRSAMPLAEAYRLCPQAAFLPVCFPKYIEASQHIRAIFLSYTPLVEPLSLDEAFLDVTGSQSLFGSAVAIATEIKQRIKSEINLTASVGVANNKFLAKLASDLKKPDGLVVVDPNQIQALLDPLPIERIWGVGQKTAARLRGLNIKTIRDVRSFELDYLVRLFGTMGEQIYFLARGIDDREVEPGRETKSLGREITFDEDIFEKEKLTELLLKISLQVGRTLRKEGLWARTVVLKIKFNDFRSITRSKTLDASTTLDEDIFNTSCQLLKETALDKPVRLIGITLGNLTTEGDAQLNLFAESQEHKEKLSKAIDSVKDRFGDKSITRARLIKTELIKYEN